MEGSRAAMGLVVMGPSGTGKTTVAELLGEQLGWTTAEADDFHPPANIEKMTGGQPLTDEDRWPWLAAIRDWLTLQQEQGADAIVTCSALKRAYRDLLRQSTADVVFIQLTGPIDLIAGRMESRRGHFMPKTLLQSQFATLEELESDEAGVEADVTNTPDVIVDQVLHDLKLSGESAPTGP